ncbi:hypothetical protein AMELA_G00251400 [Ameiurus melas]|uniref:Uncharacterized protein n=1 Tax=Ameiurus melas TaxID=219545 RepID=A0A7J5ZSP8_AMEME|nr:hypothetical protein AMELA_G00251400 [Ameiurus melas]
MADSDDEYDRRRRDKFRRERSDYDRSREREERRRDDWSDRLGNIHDLDLGPPPPVMKTFKEFLLSLERRCGRASRWPLLEYKIEFRRQQMQEFFLAHKEKSRYDRGQ